MQRVISCLKSKNIFVKFKTNWASIYTAQHTSNILKLSAFYSPAEFNSCKGLADTDTKGVFQNRTDVWVTLVFWFDINL